MSLDLQKNRKAKAMRLLISEGVKIIDPEHTYIESSVKIGKGTTIYPFVFIYGNTVIGRNCTIWPMNIIMFSRIGNSVEICSFNKIKDCVLGNSVLVDSHCKIKEAKVGNNCNIGPHAHLDSGTILSSFVEIGTTEVARSWIGKGTKALHGRYIGDARIGKDCNIGAGTVFCNYDGKEKHQTILKDEVFIGSGSLIVAKTPPIVIGKGAYVAAGTVVTQNVPAGNLAIRRPREQTHKKIKPKKSR